MTTAFSRIQSLLVLLFSLLLVFLSSCSSVQQSNSNSDPDSLEQLFPESDATYDRISAAILLGDPQQAIAAYEEARLEDPDEPQTLVLLANLYIAAGELDAAREILDPIAAGDGQEALDAKLALSLIARFQGDEQAELEAIAAVLEADPENPRANSALGEILLEDKSYDQAEIRFQKALESNPEDFVSLQGLANAYLLNGKSQESIEVFTKAIEVEPDYSYNYSDRAKAQIEQGYRELAIADMDRAIEIEPENGWHYLDRGRMQARGGEFVQAEQDFTRALELLPQVFLIHSYRGHVRAYMEDYDGAREDFQAALGARDDYYPDYPFFAAMEYIAGNYDSASSWFVRAYEADQTQVNYLLFAAAALYAKTEWEGDRFLEQQLSKFDREGLLYQTGRFYVSNVDMQLMNQMRQEDDRRILAFAQFYTGLRNYQLGLDSTALALFESEEQDAIEGSPESLVRDWLIHESTD